MREQRSQIPTQTAHVAVPFLSVIRLNTGGPNSLASFLSLRVTNARAPLKTKTDNKTATDDMTRPMRTTIVDAPPEPTMPSKYHHRLFDIRKSYDEGNLASQGKIRSGDNRATTSTPGGF